MIESLPSIDFVVDHAYKFAQRIALTPRQREGLERGLSDLRQTVLAQKMPACVYLPLLSYAGVCGAVEPALPLAAAATLLNAGRHLIDDVTDGEISPVWTRQRPAEVMLNGVALLTILPQIALLELDVSLECRADLQAIALQGLLRMHAGQQLDLVLTSTARPDLREVEASVIGKTGEGYAMYCALGARLGGADSTRRAAFAAMGLALGTAYQLVSDCHDILSQGDSADLRARTRTLPLALHLRQLTGRDHQDFLRLLDETQTDITARQEVQRQMIAGGVLRVCHLLIESYRQKARSALDQTQAQEPWRTEIEAMIEHTALVPAR